jgi:hypothetical protein
VIVNAIIDLRSSPDHPLGDAVETFVRREDAERFIEEVRGDEPDLATYRLGLPEDAQRVTARASRADSGGISACAAIR